MKHLRSILLLVAAATLAVLLAKLDRALVWHYLTAVGWGMVFIEVQEVVPMILNALAWRFAYRPGARIPRFFHLAWVRLVGDSVNYLTPSATIAGEFARLEALDGATPTHATATSIAVAKLGQTLAQAVFITLGLLAIVAAGDRFFPGYGPWLRRGALGGAAVLVLFALAAFAWHRHLLRRGGLKAENAEKAWTWRAALSDLPRQCLSFMGEHPLRFVVVIAFFVAAYAWTAVESYWTCRFLGIPITAATAMVIEVLSNLVDGLTFMVPAKVGTQEGGKTAIFAALGLGANAGFAMGVIRHLRELSWSAFGFTIYALERRARLAKQEPPQSPANQAPPLASGRVS